MPSLNRRDRVIIFRVTRREYENLKQACADCGARNLSDYVRSQTLQATDRDHSEVLDRLSELQSWIYRLTQLLEANTKRDRQN